VLAHQPLQLSDRLTVAAQRQLASNPPLDSGHVQLRQPRDVRLREAVVIEVGQRAPAPQLQRTIQRRRRSHRVACRQQVAALRDQRLEPLAVQLTRLNPQ